MLRRKLLSVQALNLFISYVRCASYPDLKIHQQHRGDVEKSWPAYSADQTLSRLPSFFWDEQAASGADWKRMYQKRLQHALSRMNHHIHPLINKDDDPMTGDRRSLISCRPKGKKARKDEMQTLCKGGFPSVSYTHLRAHET